MQIVFLATNNQHKLKEFKEVLKDYQVISLEEIGYTEEIAETGETFLDNALIKAKTISQFLQEKGFHYLVVAEDSGLCVDVLDGEPGIYSARYASSSNNSALNREKLLKELAGKERTAYFIATIVVYYPSGEYKSFVGKTFGEITLEERGKKDFGYDCLFYSYDLKKTFGEASDEEKNSVSHRGRAIEAMLKEI